MRGITSKAPASEALELARNFDVWNSSPLEGQTSGKEPAAVRSYTDRPLHRASGGHAMVSCYVVGTERRTAQLNGNR
jgi:hypothetical protein